MRIVCLAVAACCLCFAASWADEPAAKGPPPAATVSAQEIDRLILQLGDDEMDKRATAAARLEAVGEPAASSLKKAAESADDPEVRKAAKLLLDKFAAKAQGLLHDFRGSNPAVYAVAITADGKRGVSAHQDGCLRIWDLERYLLVRQIAGHSGPALSVAYSVDGKQLLSGSGDQTMKLWDVATGAGIRSFGGHPDSVVDVDISPDGKTFLSACSDRHARLWDASSGKLLRTLKAEEQAQAWSVAYVPDGKRVITAGLVSVNSGNRSAFLAPVRLWDLTSGKEIRQFAVPGETVGRVAISPDGKHLLAVDSSGVIWRWDVDTGKRLRPIDLSQRFDAVRYKPNGKQIICSNAAGGAPAAAPRLPGGAVVAAIPAADDRQYGFSMWDLATGKEIKQFGGHRNPVTCFAVSADGRRLLSGSTDGSMRLWELPK